MSAFVTDIDVISDALLAALVAGAPSGVDVLDHGDLPWKVEDLPPNGVMGLYLIEDSPTDETADSVGRHARRATFRVELRVPGSDHILHSTKALRKAVATTLKNNPTLGGVVMDSMVGTFRPALHETSSQIGCGSVDVTAEYVFDPEAA